MLLLNTRANNKRLHTQHVATSSCRSPNGVVGTLGDIRDTLSLGESRFVFPLSHVGPLLL